MRRHYLSLRRQWRQLEPVDRAALALIPAALIVAGLIIAPWHTAGVTLVVAALAASFRRAAAPRNINRTAAVAGPASQWANPWECEVAAEPTGPTRAEAIAAAEWYCAQATAWRESAESLAEMLDTARAAAKIHASNCEIEGDRAWAAEVESYKADKLLRREMDRTAKLRGTVDTLREKLTRRRERAKARLERQLARETATASIVPVVHAYGGIDPQSHEFRTVYSTRKAAIEDGIPGYLLRRGGCALDILAQQMESGGYITTPDDRHAGDWLLECIRRRTPSAAYLSDRPYTVASELDALRAEEELDASFDVEAFA